MSGNSYPSPVSSSRSPTLGDIQAVPAGTILEPTTQRNLLQTSVALEAAYRRIRQARRNLLELTETIPLQDVQTRANELNDLDPGYEAITLTGEHGTSRETAYSNTETRMRRYETIPALDFQDTDRSASYDAMPSNSIGSLPFTPSHPPTMHLPPLSPYSPPMFLHPRRLQPESQLTRRREFPSNDPTTSIGRRVAAREAGGIASPSSLSPWDGAPARLATAIEWDIEQVRIAAAQRRTDPGRPEAQSIDTTSRVSRSLDIDTTRRTTRNQVLQTRATNSTPPLGPPVESRRQRSGRGSVYPSPQSPTSNQSGRLSILSNLPVQNLTTPVSAVSRPLLFEEPSSYIPAADFTRPYATFRDDSDVPVGGERSYVIRRTINADGEEHVHPISLEWNEEEASPWALPRRQRDDLFVEYMSPPRRLHGPSVRYVQRSDTVQIAQTDGNALSSRTRRRRGWARLDPDGNEIPSDEEEELERVRADVRVHAQLQSRSSLASLVDGVDARPRMHPPHSNTMISETDLHPGLGLEVLDPVSNWNYGRIADLVPLAERPSTQPGLGLEVRDPVSNWNYGRIADLVPLAERPSTQPPLCHTSRHPPFVPNPLPMPLDDMVMSCTKKAQRNDAPCVIRAAGYASLAGR